MNNGGIIWSTQSRRKQGVLRHQLGNWQVPVKLVTHKLAVAEGFLKAVLLNLPITNPATQHPRHRKGDHEHNKSAYPVGHSPVPATPLKDARVSPTPLKDKGAGDDSKTQTAAKRLLRWRCIKNAKAASPMPARSDTIPPSIISSAAPINSKRTIQEAVTLPNQPNTPPESRYTPKSAVTSARAMSNHPASINKAPL